MEQGDKEDQLEGDQGVERDPPAAARLARAPRGDRRREDSRLGDAVALPLLCSLRHREGACPLELSNVNFGPNSCTIVG